MWSSYHKTLNHGDTEYHIQQKLQKKLQDKQKELKPRTAHLTFLKPPSDPARFANIVSAHVAQTKSTRADYVQVPHWRDMCFASRRGLAVCNLWDACSKDCRRTGGSCVRLLGDF